MMNALSGDIFGFSNGHATFIITHLYPELTDYSRKRITGLLIAVYKDNFKWVHWFC